MENKRTSHRQLILDILESAVANVQQNEEEINDLNVFPIPDGDTGSNMLATLVGAWNNISVKSQSDVEILQDFSKGALMGARGNSGVIISQIIKGLFIGVQKVGKFSRDIKELKFILASAKEYAYNAVAEPVEGTILSVVNALDKKYKINASSFLEAFEDIANIAKIATKETPNQLPVLKESGVVDSGAFGLVKFIEGAILGLKGEAIKLRAGNSKHNPKKERFIKANPTKNIGYCTEFILTLAKPNQFDEGKFKKYLESVGDSIVIIKDDDVLKVHVHTKNPGNIFSEAQKHGEFSNIKAENMSIQVETEGHEVEGGIFNIKKNKAETLGIIAVSNGRGLDKEFSDLGVDAIVSGGQSMNPSVKEFMEYVDDLSNKNILILPNNRNIILTAEMVKKNVKDKNIFVLPTKTLAQGIVALKNINKEMIEFDDYVEGIMEDVNDISEGQITIAIRNTEMYGIKVKKGQFISMKDRKIISSTNTFEESFEKLIDDIAKEEVEVIYLFYNDDVNIEQFNHAKKYINKKYPSIEFIKKYGGQSVYHGIVFGEK